MLSRIRNGYISPVVIPGPHPASPDAEPGIHFDLPLAFELKMDPGFRRDDGFIVMLTRISRPRTMELS
jgi:hypothetical protein